MLHIHTGIYVPVDDSDVSMCTVCIYVAGFTYVESEVGITEHLPRGNCSPGTITYFYAEKRFARKCLGRCGTDNIGYYHTELPVVPG